MDKIYIAVIGAGEYEDYRENQVFATDSKEKAEKWKDRYNKIIEDNKKRIMAFDYTSDEREPFWYDEVNWDKPHAFVKEVEFRKG